MFLAEPLENIVINESTVNALRILLLILGVDKVIKQLRIKFGDDFWCASI